MTQRRQRNRKRSKRRAIYCPIHSCYLDSVSQKYPLYASKAEHLQQRGLSRKRALTLVAGYGTVTLQGEWIEAFWCPICQETEWYHVRKTDANSYTLSKVPEALWAQAAGVICTTGNPTVSEFTRRHARQAYFRRGG